MINNLNIKSFNFISDKGYKNNLNYYLKNTITAGKNNVEYDSSPEVKFSNIIEMQSSFPLIKLNKNYSNYSIFLFTLSLPLRSLRSFSSFSSSSRLLLLLRRSPWTERLFLRA